jgi:hypothetical protein
LAATARAAGLISTSAPPRQIDDVAVDRVLDQIAGPPVPRLQLRVQQTLVQRPDHRPATFAAAAADPAQRRADRRSRTPSDARPLGPHNVSGWQSAVGRWSHGVGSRASTFDRHLELRLERRRLSTETATACGSRHATGQRRCICRKSSKVAASPSPSCRLRRG